MHGVRQSEPLWLVAGCCKERICEVGAPRGYVGSSKRRYLIEPSVLALYAVREVGIKRTFGMLESRSIDAKQ